jgi:hypothetical protein
MKASPSAPTFTSTQPTCALTVNATPSPLARWSDRPLVTGVRFQLTLDPPLREVGDQLAPQTLQLEGDGEQLQTLADAIEDYVQKLLVANFADLTSQEDDRLGSRTLGATPVAVETTPIAAGAGIALHPQGLVSHRLELGPLRPTTTAATPTPGSITLSTIQLFDLSNALGAWSQAMALLPGQTSSRPWLLPNLPVWVKSTAVAAVVLGASAVALQMFYGGGIGPIASGNRPPNVATGAGEGAPLDDIPMGAASGGGGAPASEPIPLPPPPAVNLPPEAYVPNGGNPGVTLLPPESVSPSSTGPSSTGPSAGSPRTGPAISPGNPPKPTPSPSGTVRPLPGRAATPPVIALAPPAPGPSPVAPRAPQQESRLPPAAYAPNPAIPTPEANSPEPPAADLGQAPRDPNPAPPTGILAPIPAPRAAAQPQRPDFGGIVSPAPISRRNAPASNQPQVREVRDYFSQRWQPPAGMNQTLEYSLVLNTNGSLQQVQPRNQAATIYLDRTPMPLANEPFVSPSASPTRLRLLLQSNGKVEVLLEAP